MLSHSVSLNCHFIVVLWCYVFFTCIFVVLFAMSVMFLMNKGMWCDFGDRGPLGLSKLKEFKHVVCKMHVTSPKL